MLLLSSRGGMQAGDSCSGPERPDAVCQGVWICYDKACRPSSKLKVLAAV